MTDVLAIIRELQGIPRALVQDPSDPRLRPRQRPTSGAETYPTESVPSTPLLDDEPWEVVDENVWNETLERIRRNVEGAVSGGGHRGGIEALAWYRSFHGDQSRWGIYIPLSSLAAMDSLYLSGVRMPRVRRLALIWRLFVLHEQVHFAVDLACAWFELLLRAPIRAEFAARRQKPLQILGARVVQSYLEVEETAANAYMLRELRRKERRPALNAIEAFVASQPSGYREGLQATSEASFAAALLETLQSYAALWAIDRDFDLGNPMLDPLQVIPLARPGVLAQCPVYAVNDLKDVGLTAGSLRLFLSIPAVEEDARFVKQLGRLDVAVRKDWERMKGHLKQGLPSPPRFEKLTGAKPPTWSLRLRSGYRVHLRPSDDSSAWRALEVGTHKEMGHG
jgi:hypothetical protein